MSARTILTMADGRGIDLTCPRAVDIDFGVLAEHLSKENRYNGATRNQVYNVADHSVRCADAALAAGEGREVVGYLLLHDAHEAFLKDDTTPKKQALAAVAQQHFGDLGDHIIDTFKLLTYRIDHAIHEAAGLVWPAPMELHDTIKLYDLTLFVTEWRDLMGAQPHPDWEPYQAIKPLKRIIEPRSWQQSRDAFLDHCWELLPALQRSLRSAL